MSAAALPWEEAAKQSSQAMPWEEAKAAKSAKAPQKEDLGFLDREIKPIPGETPMSIMGIPMGYPSATLSGLQSIGRGVRSAVQGVGEILKPPSWDEIKEAASTSTTPGDLPMQILARRTTKPLEEIARQAPQVPAAIHDINQSADPLGTYAKVAQETAGQGAGQAITALATEGAARALPKVVDTVRNPVMRGKPVRIVARTAEDVVNSKLNPLKAFGNLDVPADEATALRVKVPGRDFGLAKPAPAAAVPPELTTPARTLPGQISPEVIRPRIASPSAIPPRQGLMLPAGETESAAGSIARSVTEPHAGRIGLSGESALRDTLGSLDSADLMKIAKSRGINVTQESQLKPSIAGPRVLNKIVEDFSPDELDEFRNTYLETERMAVNRPGSHPSAHDFQFEKLGPENDRLAAEAHRTMTLQSYFPDVNIPAARLIRTRTAITNAPLANPQPEMAPVGNLAKEISNTAKAAAKTAPKASIARPNATAYRARSTGVFRSPRSRGRMQ